MPKKKKAVTKADVDRWVKSYRGAMVEHRKRMAEARKRVAEIYRRRAPSRTNNRGGK